MKHILLLISIVTLVSCSQEPAATFESTTDTVKRSGNNYGIVYVADLFAGQTTLVGSLEIANYNDTFYIKRYHLPNSLKKHPEAGCFE